MIAGRPFGRRKRKTGNFGLLKQYFSSLLCQGACRKIPNFTGIDSPYEPPTQPDLHLRADHEEVSVLAEQVLAWLEARD